MKHSLKCKSLIELIQTIAQTLRPPPKLSLSQWADARRRLSNESSAEPGRWLTARAEYQRGIMDSLSDSKKFIGKFIGVAS